MREVYMLNASMPIHMKEASAKKCTAVEITAHGIGSTGNSPITEPNRKQALSKAMARHRLMSILPDRSE
ncbi:hypothetical protein RvY_02243 [Ramazzottius varieornatus]|uniref:Uncharacterized protein n=1 Tax=Ramazzottius varieornatus TaxID=947166 RepID=A0A1D1UMF3_RAMVA|nr:hypothetical protein RvY_02243 [Ramazzottius varieornatus]